MVGLCSPAVARAQSATPPKPYVVAVVPGHGGDDPGAIYPPNSDHPLVEEKNLTLPIALKLRDRLQRDDVKVVMTRTGDITTTGEQRAAIAEKAQADIFVAVHINSYYADGSVRGAEAQYFSDPKLSDDVADGLLLSIAQFDETVRTSKDREQDNILTMPGVIVEAGYLSNSADRQLIQTPGYQDAVAEGIYQGILKYAPQITELKAQIEAYNAVHATKPAVRSPAVPPVDSRHLPGWLAPAGIAAGLLLAYRLALARSRRRRKPAYHKTVIRYR